MNVREVQDRQQASEKVAVLVLGMHRSGTSALARVLNLLGCSLPQQVMDGNLSNPVGHWEPQAIVELNDEILEAAGSAWNDWQQLNPGWEKSPVRAGFMRKAARTLQSEYEDSSFFVVKDPRICRIAPFWLDVLSENSIDPRIIIPVRNPLDVAASLYSRDGIDPSLGYLIWLRHILDAERGTRGVRRVFTTDSQLLDNWTKVAEHIADGLDINWPRYSPRVVGEIENFLDKRLRNHNRNDRDTLAGTAVPGWVRQAYDIVLRWSEGGEASDDFADLDAIKRSLDEAALSFGTPMTLFQQATVHLQDARGHVVAADRDRDAAIGRVDMVERSLQERGEEIARLASRLTDTEDQCETVRGERDEALGRVAAAEQLLRQRGEELAAVESDLKAAEMRKSELQIELASAHELGVSVEQALIQHRREHDEAVGKLAEAGSELLQRKEELRQVWAELDAEKQRAEVLETALEAGSATLKSMESQLSDACANNALLKAERERNKQELARWQELVKREQERERERLLTLEKAQKELASVRSAFEASKKSLEQAKSDSAESKARLEGVQAELEKTHAAARSAVSQRSQTFNEIAIVTQLLRDSEHDVQNRDEIVQWLSQVYAIMLRRPRWWVFLSRTAQFKRLSKRIEQRGMFDSGAYLAKNPDVAATGVDPLRHYITHGIKESRPR